MGADAPPPARQIAEAILLDPSRRGKLFAFARHRYGIGADDAEDLLQETAFELLRHRGYVRSPDGFVFTVFRARCARFVHAASNRRRVFAGGSGETEACDPMLPDGVDRQVALREALSGISASCRRLLAAYYIEGRSLREAAHVVSLQYSSVPKTINRCLKKLRACFA
ncbi:MAG TPA: sigma-70 family RNA polymerase sigma factor [Thermoanaerobaculia bacterium]|jgi:RNA polymerase sigma factor (sigma-70 family)|nr:sigma-70 family RNA polymerase sigma factor [Thermoanaerobaculia bacterium]